MSLCFHLSLLCVSSSANNTFHTTTGTTVVPTGTQRFPSDGWDQFTYMDPVLITGGKHIFQEGVTLKEYRNLVKIYFTRKDRNTTIGKDRVVKIHPYHCQWTPAPQPEDLSAFASNEDTTPFATNSRQTYYCAPEDTSTQYSPDTPVQTYYRPHQEETANPTKVDAVPNPPPTFTAKSDPALISLLSSFTSQMERQSTHMVEILRL